MAITPDKIEEIIREFLVFFNYVDAMQTDSMVSIMADYIRESEDLLAQMVESKTYTEREAILYVLGVAMGVMYWVRSQDKSKKHTGFPASDMYH